MARIDDCAHVWGNDLQVSPSGDLLRASGIDRSKQHVLRRLLTNPAEYLDHPDYGAGVPASVGTILNVPNQIALIRGQMLIEPSVAPDPEPSVGVIAIPGGVKANLAYTALPDQQPALLTFSVDG